MAERSECIFCRIADGEVPATIVREDEHTVAFRDLDPQAPLHVLVIPRRHIASINEVADDDAAVMGALLIAARDLAAAEGVAANGYRLVINTGAAANQTVHHVHLHVIGGRDMSWPPG
ncbi:MAG TPA: histidine triad nucleotide-binding protein [Longimicrobiales bacterium]|nr:histidine triad nucleotide-binding protein [Longimicrobiales bacterium]